MQQRAKLPRYSLNYIALIRYKFLLTYSLWQTVTQWYPTDLPGSSSINTFSQQKSELVATRNFFRLISEVPSHWGNWKAQGRTSDQSEEAGKKCVDDVAVSICCVVTVIRIKHKSFQFPKISGKLSVLRFWRWRPYSGPSSLIQLLWDQTTAR